MPYINKEVARVKFQKTFSVLLELGYSMSELQRLIDRGRVACDGVVITQKNQVISGVVSIIEYQINPKGLKPIFECDDFAVFDKPSGVLSHPNGRKCEYSLCDEIWHLYGTKACIAHRLDKETSGLIVVAKKQDAQIELKSLFQNRKVTKIYQTLVYGKCLDDFRVDEPIGLVQNYDDIKTRMTISIDGKSAITDFKKIKYFDDLDATLLQAMPLTGRQHQIRLHLYHKGHKIYGEPLYGLSKDQVIALLESKMSQDNRILLTGALRLMLHASQIKFVFKGKEFDIRSNFDPYENFYKAIKKVMKK